MNPEIYKKLENPFLSLDQMLDLLDKPFELIRDEQTMTICTDHFVLDINNEKINLIFVNEIYNQSTYYILKYLTVLLENKRFLMFYVLLKYLDGHFAQTRNEQRRNTEKNSDDEQQRRNTEKNIGKNTGENIRENIGENIRENIGENIRENSDDELQQNSGKNTEQNKEDTRKNTEQNTRDDEQQNKEQNTRDDEQQRRNKEGTEKNKEDTRDDERIKDLIMRLHPIFLKTVSPCGLNYFYYCGLTFCKCILSENRNILDVKINIFTHLPIEQKPVIENQDFLLLSNGRIKIKNKNYKEIEMMEGVVNYLKNNGLFMEEIIEFVFQ